MSAILRKINHAKEIIRKAKENHPQIAVPFSGGKDSLTVLLLARMISSQIKIFSIMTPYKFKETMKYLCKVNKLLNSNIQIFIATDEIPKVFENSGMSIHTYPDLYEQFKNENGTTDNILKTERCCELLKVIPFQRALEELQLNAWISGLRKGEGPTRKNIKESEKIKGRLRVSPILDWSIDDICIFLKGQEVPINPLYKEGYLSLGCEPCTRIPLLKGDERSGRFIGREKCECGIHKE